MDNRLEIKDDQQNFRDMDAKDEIQQQQTSYLARQSTFLIESNSQQALLNNRLNMVLVVLLISISVTVIAHHILFENQIKIDNQLSITQNHHTSSSSKMDDQQNIQMKTRIQQQKNKKLEQQFRQKQAIKNIDFEEKNQQNQGQSKRLNSQNSINIYNSHSLPSRWYLNLSDFIIQKPYLEAPQDIKAIFQKMITRQQGYHKRPNVIFHPTQKAYFAYNLYRFPNNPDFRRAEYFYYDNKYQISKFGAIQDQLPLCIIAPGRNIVSNNKYKRFIQSIYQQNYTNYKVVYVDDLSDDNSPRQLKRFIEATYPELNNRLVIVENTERIYALGNRNKAVRHHCDENDIILDVDADDALIGSLVFQFVNTVYHNQQVWQANSAFIYISEQVHEVTVGNADGIPEDLLKNNQYRGSMVWKSDQLRTYRAKLFNKIDENDFKDENGKFYEWASDHFIQEPLTQLSGFDHYRYFYQILYFYDWKINRKTIYKRRHYRDIAWTQKPYKPLKTLNENATKVEIFTLSEKMKNEYDKNIEFGRKQALKNHQRVPF